MIRGGRQEPTASPKQNGVGRPRPHTSTPTTTPGTGPQIEKPIVQMKKTGGQDGKNGLASTEYDVPAPPEIQSPSPPRGPEMSEPEHCLRREVTHEGGEIIYQYSFIICPDGHHGK